MFPLSKITAIVLLAFLLIAQGGFAKEVYIQGHWKNGPSTVFLNVWEDVALGKNGSVASEIDSLDGSFEFHLEMTHPAILGILNNFFIVEPGDSVFIELNKIGEQIELSFTGKKRVGQNFLSRLKREIKPFRLDRYSLKDTKALEKYKEAATNHFDSCLIFLTKYFSEEAGSIRDISRDLLTIRFYNNLLFPLTVKVSKGMLPRGYFDQIDPSFFTKENLLGFREFILLIRYYNTYFASSIPQFGFDSAVVSSHIESAYKTFDRSVKDDLLLSIVSDLTQRGSSQNETQINQLFEYLTKAFANHDERMIQISEYKRSFEILGKPLPNEILSQTVSAKNGQTLTLKDILSGNEVIYVDFWASWCGPCILEMPKEKKLISELKGQKVKFILISLDEDKDKWLKAVAKVNIDGEHYLLSDGFRSPLVQYLSFNQIPRYVILDRHERLNRRDAPGPGFILQNKSVLLNLLD